MFEAVVLVVVVIIVFLQTWRASIIPIVAIPVSLIGTFAMLAALGFSLNNLSLFGLVLAIGIVVDDAIVVVENVERNIREGLSPREAAYKTMEEVGGALIAIALVLSAVFIPSAFLTGITGQFFRQFAVTIATATAISLLVSLTLSPALCALLFKPHEPKPRSKTCSPRPIRAFFNGFNRAFEWVSSRYGALTARLVRVSVLMLLVYAGLIALTAYQFVKAPTGFIPAAGPGLSDQHHPAAARRLARPHRRGGAQGDRRSCSRRPASPMPCRSSGSTAPPSPPRPTPPWCSRRWTTSRSAPRRARARKPDRRAQHPIRGDPGGLRGQRVAAAGARHRHHRRLQDGGAGHPRRRAGATRGGGYRASSAAPRKTPGLANVFTTFNTRTPKVYADIDRVRAEMLGVNTDDVFQTLEVYLGSQYVNDFNFLGRTYRVTAQADGDFRQDLHAIGQLKTRNASGEMVPLVLGRLVPQHHRPLSRRALQSLSVRRDPGRHAAPGYSSGYGLAAMERLAQENLPEGYSYSLDRDRLPGEARRQHGDLHLPRLGGVRVPAARRAV